MSHPFSNIINYPIRTNVNQEENALVLHVHECRLQEEADPDQATLDAHQAGQLVDELPCEVSVLDLHMLHMHQTAQEEHNHQAQVSQPSLRAVLARHAQDQPGHDGQAL